MNLAILRKGTKRLKDKQEHESKSRFHRKII